MQSITSVTIIAGQTSNTFKRWRISWVRNLLYQTCFAVKRTQSRCSHFCSLKQRKKLNDRKGSNRKGACSQAYSRRIIVPPENNFLEILLLNISGEKFMSLSLQDNTNCIFARSEAKPIVVKWNLCGFSGICSSMKNNSILECYQNVQKIPTTF